MKQLINKRFTKIAFFTILGGIGGFAYYYYIGCNGGTCPISSNPYISTSYGMMIGLLMSFDSKKNKKSEQK